MRPSSDLKTMDVRSSARKQHANISNTSKLHKGKANLGLDYEGLEVGGELVSQSPNKNKYLFMAQSIELGKNSGSMAANLLNDDANSERQIVERLKKPPAMYRPEMNGSGSFMARNLKDGADAAARDSIDRIARASALSINFPSGASNSGRTAAGLSN